MLRFFVTIFIVLIVLALLVGGPVVIGLIAIKASHSRVAGMMDFDAFSGGGSEDVDGLDVAEDPAVDIANLNGRGLVYMPELARAGAAFPYFDNAAAHLLRAALSEYPMPVTYAYRPRHVQERLYAARGSNPNPVARPGGSPHEGGFAIDTPARSISYDALLKKRITFRRWGARWGGRYEGGVLAGDPPHFAWPPERYGYRSLYEAIAINHRRFAQFRGATQ